MARKTFHHALFEPPLWDLGHHTPIVMQEPELLPTAGDLVMEVVEPAPEGCPRQQLRTKVVAQARTPHEAFAAFAGTHDEVKRLSAYADPDGNGPDPDEVQERILVQPRRFQVYEFTAQPGYLYVTAQELTMKQVFRRYRTTHSDDGTTYSRRVVRLESLEHAVANAEVVGYVLLDVAMTTPVERLDVQGLRISQNLEVQDAKSKAEQIKAVSFRLQAGDEIVRVQIDRNGSVAFINYPGDETALGILDRLESIIDSIADTESIGIRQSRSR